MKSEPEYICVTRSWIKNFVVGLNLCPFAKAPLEDNKVKFLVGLENHPIPIFNSLFEMSIELRTSKKYKTAFLILPNISCSFPEFYDLSTTMEELLLKEQCKVRLIAFHPSFTYDSTDVNDTTNATNRSPYPMIHILIQDDLAKVKTSDTDVDMITENNKAVLNKMNWSEILHFTSAK